MPSSLRRDDAQPEHRKGVTRIMGPWTALTLILVLAFFFVTPYVLYGLVLRLIKPTGKASGNVGPFVEVAPEDDERPLVSLLIPAHNEAEHLRSKLNNTLSLAYPADRLEIIVCSDGSTDATDEIAKKFEGRGVTLVRNAERSGKATALKTLFDASRGGLLVFTDASATLATDTVARLVHAATDPTVGVAAARYVVGGEQADPEAGYWGAEAKLRKSEAEREMLLGASGACYLIRRELFTAPPSDTINDDYIIPMLARERGFKIAYVHDATAGDPPTDSSETLYFRWVRIAYGNYQMLWRH
ncbi:MAG: biofilm PGA synthesis N-glycosyltransferase PgaC, partial [Myxococcota bacterium]